MHYLLKCLKLSASYVQLLVIEGVDIWFCVHGVLNKIET